MSSASRRNDEEKMDNWKQFQGTDLGSLMGSIYGNENKPKISYPRLRPGAKARAPPTEPFLPGGARAGASDPRKATKVDKKVAVPIVGRGARASGRSYAKVDFIPHRRSEADSKADVDDILMRQKHFRPAHVKAVSTDSEKDKYSQICTYKGGKGLPAEMTHPQGEAPFERAERKKQAEAFQRGRDQRHALKHGGNPRAEAVEGPPLSTAPALSHQEELATQVAAEIQERCDFLDEMTAMGASAAEMSTVRREISKRVAELKVLEKRI